MTTNLTRSVLVAKDLSDNYTNVRSDRQGNLNTSVVTDQWSNLAIAEILNTYGDIVTIKPKTLFKYGRNLDLDVGIPETIWGTGGNETFVNTNTIDRVVSTDALDSETISIEGHTLSGSEFTFVVQDITLNGQTPVSLTTPLARCSRIANNNGTDILGLVSVFDTTGTATLGVVTPASAIHCQIELGRNQSQKCQTTFSKSDYGFVTQVTGGPSSKTNALVEYDLQIREVNKVWKTKFQWGSSGSSVVINFAPYLIVPKNADVRIVGISNTNNTEVFASFNCIFGLVQ